MRARAMKTADPNKDQQIQVGIEESVIDSVRNSVTSASREIFDAKDESIDSSTNNDGGETDDDDMPETFIKIAVPRQSRMQVFVQRFNHASFFQGSRYRIMSAFGPMTCLFIIA
jgi:hypothetical protein